MKYFINLLIVLSSIAFAINDEDKRKVKEGYGLAKTIVFADKKYGKLDKVEKGEEADFKYTFKYSSNLSKDQIALYKKITKEGKTKDYSANIKPQKITKKDKKLLEALKKFPDYKERENHFKVIGDTNYNGKDEAIDMWHGWCGSGGCSYPVYEPNKSGNIKEIYTIDNVENILNIKINGNRVRIYRHCSGYNNCTEVMSHKFNGEYKVVFEYVTRRK